MSVRPAVHGDVEIALGRAELLHRPAWERADAQDWMPLLEREWLVTNGLGGYASGTIVGVATRRYHGLLIAAFPPPLGRRFMLGELGERVTLPDGSEIRLGGEETPEDVKPHGASYLDGFRLEGGLPVWTYDLQGARVEKRVAMPYMQNTVAVEYRLVAGGALRLALSPHIHFRSHDDPVDSPLAADHLVRECDAGWEIVASGAMPPLRLRFAGGDASFHEEIATLPRLLYRIEASRGYAAVGPVWTPGAFSAALEPGGTVCFLASCESWDAMPPADAAPLLAAELARRDRLLSIAGATSRDAVGAELVLAADQFIIRPPRQADTARAQAEGSDARSVIAGYHWFTDWGRDTMVSLEGLTLATGRRREAAQILRTFGRHMRGGLIPNLFPEGENDGLYHTADATLWFFHALDRYRRATTDNDLLASLLPRLRESIDCHVSGTAFGIGVDPADGLLRQGAEGYQLTWMDAKVDGWVVTPRRGKAVEINALWYNALRLMEEWEREIGESRRAGRMAGLADRARDAFNERFWIDDERYLYDVVDGETGDDPTFRPNQILSMSLAHPVLREDRWAAVLETVAGRLLTPVGLRSLDPADPDYRPQYFGDLRSRDAAYHQGTVWGWLIGPFVDAWLRVHPADRAGARQLLLGLTCALDYFCVGSLAEIFDGEPPHRPRGCIAQAWTVAETLRCWTATADRPPVTGGSTPPAH